MWKRDKAKAAEGNAAAQGTGGTQKKNKKAAAFQPRRGICKSDLPRAQ